MRARVLVLTLSFLVVLLTPVAARAATEVVVQGTTDTRDAGLVDDVIVSGFQAAYPQYTLKYIAVGTGQALTNARAGQGDAVLTHSPPLEAQFVADGYSYEADGPRRDVQRLRAGRSQRRSGRCRRGRPQ